MTLKDLWLWVSDGLKSVGILAAGGGAFYALFTYGSKLKGWRKRRERREEALAKIVEQAASGDLVTMGYCQEHQRKMSEFSADVGQLRTTVANLVEAHQEMAELDRDRDQRIRDSLEERSLIATGVMALLDHAIDNGANGSAHAARDNLRTHQNMMAHRE